MKQVFMEAAIIYENALKDSGYNKKLTYNPRKVPNNSKNRKRGIKWFYPPYSENVETKIGYHFLKPIGQHFPVQHKFHKIFNRNTVKVSYSCTKNMKTIIHKHNSQILNKSDTTQDKQTCNCIQKDNCPFNGNCLTDNIIYEARITSDKPNYQEKVYIGLAETTFKKRYSNHKKSFNVEKYKKIRNCRKKFGK